MNKSASGPDEIADFYAKYYSDWTVHELSLTIYIPTNNRSREEALELLRKILDNAEFDIKFKDGGESK